jgi:manganese transport protein
MNKIKFKIKIKDFVASIMPGIFIIGYNIGTGSVTSMSKAGANFGFDLLWTLLLSCLMTWYLILYFSKYTMVTGETFIQGLKRHIHPVLALGMIIALSIVIFAALIGLLGILADVLHVWSATFFVNGIASVWWAVIITVALYSLLWIGNFGLFEKVLTLLVAIMGIAFILTMFINFPAPGKLAQGFIPQIPENALGSDNSPMVIIAGMVGTTVSVFAFIIRSQVVKATGWKMKDNAIQKRDALVSVILMFIISAAVLITAATTLHIQGLKMNHVAEMIPLLEPLAGKAAITVFTLGILAAGISSHLPNLLVIPWLIIDYRDEVQNTKTLRNRIILFALSLIAVLGVAMRLKSVFLLLLSQASIAIILPVSIISLFYLTSKKSLMGKIANKWIDKIILTFISLFSVYICLLGVKGVVSDIINFLGYI